jgi:signal transduction histidine kinase
MKPITIHSPWDVRGIQARVLLLVGIGMLSSLAILGGAVWVTARSLTDQLMAERRLLARSFADHLEHVVASTFEILQNASTSPRVAVDDPDPVAVQGPLRDAYLRSHLLESVSLARVDGEIIASEPGGRRPTESIGRALAEQVVNSGRPVVSNLITYSDGRRRLYLLMPVRNWQGEVVGLTAGAVDPAGSRFASHIQPFNLGATGSADLVDSNGMVIGSTEPTRRFIYTDHGEFIQGLIRSRQTAVGTCHGCHRDELVDGRVREVMAFAPLTTVPWGVSVRQEEAAAFAPIERLRRHLFWIVPGLLGVALVFAWGASWSVRKPLEVLTEAAERITAGHIAQPIPPLGADEVGRLGRAMEEMRVALKSSLDETVLANQELEQRVEARTRELQVLYRELRERDELRGQLLRKVISAQEDERKRIARELHDETSQMLSALVMKLETTLAMLPAEHEARARLAETKSTAVRTLEELHRLILALRPSVLDDLGLLSAIRWVAERQLEPLGMAVRCEFSGLDRRLPPQLETALFRVVQEAVTNIARHSEADGVLIQCGLKGDRLTIEIEDDGKGFAPESVDGAVDGQRGLGLLGMKERVELFGGTVQVDSSPGNGTRLLVSVSVQGEAASG